MIVVRVELHSAITGEVSTLGTMIISNDGTGDSARGNYDVKIGRRGIDYLKYIWKEPQRRARVEKYPRKAYTVWELVRRALNRVYTGK